MKRAERVVSFFKKYRVCLCFLLAVLSIAAFDLVYVHPTKPDSTRWLNILTSFSGWGMSEFCCVLALWYVYCRALWVRPFRADLAIFSVVFAACMIVGECYQCGEGLGLAVRNRIFLIKDFVFVCGYSVPFYCLLSWIEQRITNCPTQLQPAPQRREWGWPKTTALTLLCWFPYLILAYPATFHYDTRKQLMQFFGYLPITNEAPYFQTWLLGTFVNFGRALCNASFGLFAYTVVQMVCAALVLAYMLGVLKSIGVGQKLRTWIWIFYAFFPIVPLYIITIGKDINFGIFVLLLSVLILEISFDPSLFFQSKAKTVCLAATLLLICLLRNAGLALLLGCTPFLLIAAKRYRKRVCAVCAIVLAFMLLWLNVFLPSKGIQHESTAANLSIPLQQTARYVKEYGSEVTADEEAAIREIMDYDALAEEYNPEISDPVKRLFKQDATKQQIRDYLNVYLKQLCKHPLCYVDALLNKSYGYFCPDDKGREKLYILIGLRNVQELNEHGFNLTSRFPNAISNMRLIMEEFFREIPFIGTMSSIGFYTWVYIVALFMTARRGNRRALFSFVPAGFVLLGCVASPVNAYFRYGLPVVFCVPLLCAVAARRQCGSYPAD